MYRVNVSSIQDFYQCRYRWVCKWVLNRVPRKEGPALTAGKLLHQIFEEHFRKGTPLPEAADKLIREAIQAAFTLPEIEREYHTKALQQIVDLQEAFPLWEEKFSGIYTLAVEEPFELVLDRYPGVLWIGRPDREIGYNGMVWHWQNRGLDKGMNFPVYTELQKRSYHEHLYGEAIARKHDLPLGGTFWNLVRKLKFRTNVGKSNEAVKTATDMFWQHPQSINLAGLLHRDVMDSMYEHVLAMMAVERAAREEYRLPAPNEKMNGGFGGKTPDPYFKVLVGEAELNDDSLFKDREDLYKEERDYDHD